MNNPNPNPSPELRALADIFEYFGNSKQAPGHSHDVPGIWDADNAPDKAGKPCEWCAKWERARATLSQITPPSLSTDVQSAATGCHEHDVSLKVAMPGVGEVDHHFAGVGKPIEVERIRRAIWGYVNAQPEDSATLPVVQFLANRDVFLAEAIALATVAAGDDEGVALRAARDEVIYRARSMPRKTPEAGGCATVHQFPLEAGEVWMLDKALTELDRLLSQGEGK